LKPLFLLAAAAAAAQGCNDEAGGGLAGASPVTVLVAASAREAVEELAALFRSGEKAPVRVSAGPSNTLALQVLEGAPAEVFLSADREWVDKVREAGLVLDWRPLLGNKLVLITPSGNPAGVKTPADLASKRVAKLALAGERVPAGRHAAEALRSLGLDRLLLEEKKVARGQDARVALGYVERGEAEAGIVYSTDARASRAVEVVYTFDPGSHGKIVYVLALLEAAAENPAARRFHDSLSSKRAGEVFEKHGFTLSP
jgi:molybdate transport system substrate-binding protein